MSGRAALLAGALACAPGSLVAQEIEPGSRDPLLADEVLASVESTYPPLLASLIERDVREGRLRGAGSIFDLDLFAKVKGTPSGYYEYTTVEAGVEQFLGVWGSSVYGGYRLTTGETLPDYYEQRTQGDGEATLGLRIPLLRGGATDAGRTALAQADVAARMADPWIARQRLDFGRAASVAYYKWLAAGRKLEIARELLGLANARTAGLEEQVADGLRAPIVLVDNQRLVVSRELDVLSAEREFQGAALALSLFLRTPEGEAVVPGEERLPDGFPSLDPALEPGLEEGVPLALERRPEILMLGFELEMVELERRLARNTLLPYLDGRIEAVGNFGEERYTDRTQTEIRGELGFKLPLQRNEAQGKVQAAEAKEEQARQKLSFARDKIEAEVRDAWIALQAAVARTERAELNVELAERMRAVEAEQFRVGASDLLALQLREQAAFEAEKSAVDAWLDAFTALADYRASVARGVPAPPES